MKLIYSFMVVALLVLGSCSSETKTEAKKQTTTETPSTQKIASTSSILGKIVLGNSKDEVKNNEEGEIIKETANEITFSKDLTVNDFEDRTYTFENSSLTKLIYTAYIESSTTADQLHNKLRSEFDNDYTKVGTMWDGKTNDISFSVFLKKTTLDNKYIVTAIFEKL